MLYREREQGDAMKAMACLKAIKMAIDNLEMLYLHAFATVICSHGASRFLSPMEEFRLISVKEMGKVLLEEFKQGDENVISRYYFVHEF
nr:hypothetical protein [Tanacetum cinerariifolium]